MSLRVNSPRPGSLVRGFVDGVPGCGRRAPVLQQAGQGAGWAGAGAGCEARLAGAGRALAATAAATGHTQSFCDAKEPTIRAGSGVGEQLGGARCQKSQKRRLATIATSRAGRTGWRQFWGHFQAFALYNAKNGVL